MTRAEYNPDGMIGLMEMLNEQHETEPSALEVMFSTHPMSSERLATARKTANTKYMGAKEYSIYRERYMDNLVELRKIEPAVKELQTAEKLMREVKHEEAEDHIATALKQAPNDYVGLLLMAKCQIAQEKYDKALPYAQKAREVYPTEAQANQISGLLLVKSEKYEAAFDSFSAYEKALPGNPYTAFFKGFSQEGMGHQQDAAQEYVRFLKQVNQGEQAKHAYYRLVEWGYIKGEAKPVVNPFAGLA